MIATMQTLEILTGCKAIGQFLGLTERQVRHRYADGTLPLFKMGDTICGRPAKLRDWIEQQEAEPR